MIQGPFDQQIPGGCAKAIEHLLLFGAERASQRLFGVRGVCIAYDGGVFMTCNLPECVLWPRIIHESAHAVSRYVPLDAELWNRHQFDDVIRRDL